MNNSVIELMLNRGSIRKYEDRVPSDETIKRIVRAGQQAPFASQLYSILLSRERDRHPYQAPLLFVICVDCHKLELMMARRGWQVVTNDLLLLLFGIQDAALMAENMVLAAESLGLGSCFLGMTPYHAENIIKEYGLPKRVFPLVELVMGYPAENLPPRPRYPLEYVLFEGRYPDLSDEQVGDAMAAMDEGYLEQDYYRKANYIIPLEGDREETFTYDNYGWSEHISRKWGQWYPSAEELVEKLRACGFEVCGPQEVPS
jgi:FMN reductase [NAD(P)H]